MEIHILTWVMDVFFIFTLHILAKRVLGMRIENKLIVVIGWCVFFFCWNVLSYLFAEIPLVNGIGSLFILICIIGWLYGGKFQSKLIITFAIMVLGITAETIVAFFYILQGVDVNQAGRYKDNYIYIGSMISKVVCFIFVKLIIKISNSPKQIKIRMSEWIEIFVVPIGSLIIFHIVAWEDYFAITMPKVVVFTVLLVINILSYYVYQKMQMQAEEMLENQLLKQQSEYYRARYDDAEKQWLSLRKMKHDIKNNYVLHMHYLENKQYDELKKAYEVVLGDLDLEKEMVHTGNVGIDAIVNFKIEMAKEAEILVNKKIEVLGEIYATHGDMNMLFGNLFDNAIEAVSKFSTNDRHIELTILADETALLIEMGNPFKGTINYDNKGNIISQKEDKNNHGLGLKIVKDVIKKYHGLLEVNTDNNYFRIKVFLYYVED